MLKPAILYKEEIQKEIPEVDAVIGTTAYDDIVKVDVFSKLFLDSVWCLKNEAFKIDEELIPPEWIKNHQSYFGLIMNDNSMDPEFHKDDCLIIRECKKMDKDGFYCVLEKDSDYVKIRKLIFKRNSRI